MKLSVLDFFNSHRMNVSSVDGRHVMCVDNGYSPQFVKGEFYSIERGSISPGLGFSFKVSDIDEKVFNKLFIPLQGDPDNLTMRDRLSGSP